MADNISRTFNKLLGTGGSRVTSVTWFLAGAMLAQSPLTFTQARSPSFFEGKGGKFNFLNGQISSLIPGAAAPRYPVCSLTFTFGR